MAISARVRSGILITLGLLAVAFVANVVYLRWEFSGPDLGFKRCTGIELPFAVMALNHVSRFDDNFLHTTHYWLLSGPAPALRELAAQMRLVRSDADAPAMLEGMDVFDGPPPEFKESFEGSADGGRNHRLVIVFPGDRAILVVPGCNSRN